MNVSPEADRLPLDNETTLLKPIPESARLWREESEVHDVVSHELLKIKTLGLKAPPMLEPKTVSDTDPVGADRECERELGIGTS